MAYKYICLIFLVLVASGLEVDPNYDYDVFCEQFGRNYEGQQYQQHKAIFDANYAALLEAVASGLDQQVSKFMDWNQTQLNAFFNFNPLALGIQAPPPPLRSSLTVPPPTFNWDDLGKVSPVKDQGGCGSCWTFSTTALFESLFLIFNNEEKDLSEQFLLECTDESPDFDGCSGGYPNRALELIKNMSGMPSEAERPYQSLDYNNFSMCTNSSILGINKNILSVKSYFGVRSIETVKQQLLEYGPLSIAIRANQSGFQNTGTSGVASCPQFAWNSLNHAVLLVGWDADYWIIKNSWGESWGNNGYVRVPIQGNDCNVRSWVTYLTTDGVINPNIEPEPQPEPQPQPQPEPTPGPTITLRIDMTDSNGDGLNNNIFGFLQDNKIVGTFGQSFTQGYSSSQTVTIPSGVYTKVVVQQLGTRTSEIGIHIFDASSNAALQSRYSGTSFDEHAILLRFCPDCTAPTSATFTIVMTDTWGDGYNGNVFKFNQEGTVTTFGETFTTGASETKTVNLPIGKSVSVGVATAGSWRAQCGFKIYDQYNQIVFEFGPNVDFSAYNILGSFCSDCFNLASVPIVKTQESGVESSSLSQDQAEFEKEKQLTIAVGVLAASTVVLLASLAIVLVKYNKVLKKSNADNPGTSSASQFRPGQSAV